MLRAYGIYGAEMLGCILKDAKQFMALQSAPDSSLIRHKYVVIDCPGSPSTSWPRSRQA